MVVLNQRQRSYKGRLFPNGEFTYGYDSANYSQEKKTSKDYERARELMYHQVEGIDEFGDIYKSDKISVQDAAALGLISDAELGEALTLSNATNPHTKKKPPCRTRGIGSPARRMIRNAAWLLEKKEGRKNLTFATITIPPLPERERRYLNQHWGEFKRRLIQSIVRRLKLVGAITHVLEVTEIQEKRFQKTGELYLHSHLVWSNRTPNRDAARGFGCKKRGGKGGQFSIDTSWLRSRVAALLKIFSRKAISSSANKEEFETPDPSYSPRVETARVKKSLVNYLSKYLSKGNSTLASIRDSGGVEDGELPRQWYYLGGAFRRVIRGLCRRLDTEDCDMLDQLRHIPQSTLKSFVWVRSLELDFGDFVLKIGASGQLTAWVQEALYGDWYASMQTYLSSSTY